MEPCGGPSIASPPFFVFETSNVPRKLEAEKTGTVNYRIENTLLPCIWKKQSLLSVIINKR
jgi:hypothetical protein